MTFSELQESAEKTLSFLAAPFLELSAIVILITSLAGIRPDRILTTPLAWSVGAPNSESFRFLRDSELLKLTPLIAIFVFILVLIVIRESIRALAQFLPPQVAIFRIVLIARSEKQHTFALWNQNADYSLLQIIQAVDEQLERRATTDSALQADIEYWVERAAQFMRAYDAIKVLAYVATICAIAGLARAMPVSSIAFRFAVIVILLTIAAVWSLMMSMHCTYQQLMLRTRLWQVPDEMWNGSEVTPNQPYYDEQLSALAAERWWQVRFIKTASFQYYFNIMRGGSIRNTAE